MIEWRTGARERYAAAEWFVRHNRHPSTEGGPWGWVDTKVPTTSGPYKWATAEVLVWSGVSGRMEAGRIVKEHNESLRSTT